MGKIEVRIRYCCCCGLTVATILIAIYTLILYSIFLGLASRSLARLINNEDDPAETCNPGLTFKPAENTVITIDPYFCTLGWYTEEMKYDRGVRYPVLILNIILFILIIIASLLVFLGIVLRIPYLLLPWIGLMCLDILRGLISCILIFILADNATERIKPIATGIFFLGLQFFHMSLVLIMVAKFQRMLNRLRGIPSYDVEPRSDKSILVDGTSVGAPKAALSKDVGYYPQGYSTYQPGAGDPRIHHPMPPSDMSPMSRDEYGRPYPASYYPGAVPGVDRSYAYRTEQYRHANNYGRTM